MKSTKLNNIQALFGGQDMFGAELLPSRFTCGNLAQDEAAFSSARGKWAKSGLHSFLSLLCSLNCCWPHNLCSIPLLLQATTTTGRGRRSVGGVPDDRRVELGGVDVNDVKGRTDGQLPQQGQGTAVHHGERTCVWGGHMRRRSGPYWSKSFSNDACNSEGGA